MICYCPPKRPTPASETAVKGMGLASGLPTSPQVNSDVFLLVLCAGIDSAGCQFSSLRFASRCCNVRFPSPIPPVSSSERRNCSGINFSYHSTPPRADPRPSIPASVFSSPLPPASPLPPPTHPVSSGSAFGWGQPDSPGSSRFEQGPLPS